jgi:hypothetical protein
MTCLLGLIPKIKGKRVFGHEIVRENLKGRDRIDGRIILKQI